VKSVGIALNQFDGIDETPPAFDYEAHVLRRFLVRDKGNLSRPVTQHAHRAVSYLKTHVQPVVVMRLQAPTLNSVSQEASSPELEDVLPEICKCPNHIVMITMGSFLLEFLGGLAHVLSGQLESDERDVDHLAILIGREEILSGCEKAWLVSGLLLSFQPVSLLQHPGIEAGPCVRVAAWVEGLLVLELSLFWIE